MSVDSGNARLEEIAKRLLKEFEDGNKAGQEQTSVRELLGWYSYARRGSYIVNVIGNKMEELGLRTDPEFRFSFIDSHISIELESEMVGGIASSESPTDPTIRIGTLEAANTIPVSAAPNEPIKEALTKMVLGDYSQLPVQTSPHNVAGIVSWHSIGTRLAHGRLGEEVRDCMDPYQVIAYDAPLLDAIPIISEHGYVLVRGEKNSISGIVTCSDIGLQFMQLAGPYLVLSEIEGHLRRLVHRKFTAEELNSWSRQENQPEIKGSADLTLGNYCRLLQRPDAWERLKLNIDRGVLLSTLDEVREIRNDVMHFDPDGLSPEDNRKLEKLAQALRDSARLGAH